MKKHSYTCKITVLFLFLVIFFFVSGLFSQGTLADYKRAEQLLLWNMDKLVFTARVDPQWIKRASTAPGTADRESFTSRFWYKINTRRGKEFIRVEPGKNIRKPAFDQEKLALSLSKISGKTYTAYELPFDTFEYVEKEKAIEFQVDKTHYKCSLENYRCEKVEPKKEQKSQAKSPNGKWIAIFKYHNLYIRPAGKSEEIQITGDGVEKYDYASAPSWYDLFNESEPQENKQDPTIRVKWSPDSQKLVTFRLDRRLAKKLYLYQSTPEKGFRAVVHSYERALPGEEELSKIEYFIFDFKKKRRIRIDIPVYPSFLEWDMPTWFKDGRRLYFVKWERGYHQVKVLEIDAETGGTRVILSEKSPTYVDPLTTELRMLKKSGQLLWTSERDGWKHIYRFDARTGKLLNQLTKGEFVVQRILHVDEKNRLVYFTAGGREKGRDPYLSHLYRVDFSGSRLRLLTPEYAHHDIRMSPNGDYFVDNYSRVDTPPRSLLRRTRDGKILRTLETGDIEKLLAWGWRWPEPFKVKARDGKTDIYGVIFRPSNFDPAKKYPIIDSTYSGPHAVRSPKHFLDGAGGIVESMAELGFIVVAIDGLGTAGRSKAFHDFSYRNLGDIGAEDHIKAIKEMAARYPYMDTERVGIYGHSAGGYDAAHALLTHPEFYKVAVSSAGNHDHRMAKVWWPELFMGHPVGDFYDEQSNLSLAGNLQGKLLLMHGDMDNNVNPASTLRLAAKLIEANKDFDLLIFPNKRHSLGDSTYFIRKLWDYFVEHLLGVKPPKEYKIAPRKKERL